jgi:hypothetical protein
MGGVAMGGVAMGGVAMGGASEVYEIIIVIYKIMHIFIIFNHKH